MQFMPIAMLNLKNFLLAVGGKAYFTRKIFTVVKISITGGENFHYFGHCKNIKYLLNSYYQKIGFFHKPFHDANKKK